MAFCRRIDKCCHGDKPKIDLTTDCLIRDHSAAMKNSLIFLIRKNLVQKTIYNLILCQIRKIKDKR